MTLASRWIWVGDSIDAGVYSDSGVGDACRLTVAQLPHLVNVSINNLSSPGQRITEGGQPGFGASVNKNAIGTVSGYSGASGVIITLGTNDYANPSTGMIEFIDQYKSLIRYVRETLLLPVVVVTPLNRADGATYISHGDGPWRNLADFTYFIQMLCYEEKPPLRPGPFLTVFKGSECPLQPCHYVADGIHLNADGHDVKTKWMISKMQSVGYWL
jgi:Lysophospholipase L1 and related esterases